MNMLGNKRLLATGLIIACALLFLCPSVAAAQENAESVSSSEVASPVGVDSTGNPIDVQALTDASDTQKYSSSGQSRPADPGSDDSGSDTDAYAITDDGNSVSVSDITVSPYRIDLMSGQSGFGIVQLENRITGVHPEGHMRLIEDNAGTRITESLYNILEEYK